MQQPPHVIVFDVNETLSDMSAMARRFAEVGAAEHLAPTWFAGVLRDGFALTAAGTSEKFADLATNGLRTTLAGQHLDRDIDGAIEHVMSGFMTLDVHPDVPEGVRDLAARGLRLVTLTNGSTQVSDQLLRNAGLRDDFEQLLSVEDAGVWKPAPGAYEYAARACDARIEQMLLVAVHPWDIDGATRAGMSTAWINRTGTGYPEHFRRPTHEITGLPELGPLLVEEGR